MLTRSGFGLDRKAALQKLGQAGIYIRQAVPVLGTHLYTIFIFAVAIGCMWLASTLSNARSLAEVRPVLQTALAPIAALFGAAPAAAIPDESITAPGQIVALDAFDVASRVSARTTFIADEGATVAEGEVIARFDDSSARAALKSAEKNLADARKALADAQAGEPSDAGALDLAYEQGEIALSDIHLNFAWIFSSAEAVLHGKDLRESRANAYVYSDLVRRFEPDIDGSRQDALDAYERTKNAYSKAVSAYRGMPHDAEPGDLEAGLAAAYTILEENADTLKSIGDFLAIVREELENEEQPLPEQLGGHEASIADALRTTNDNLEAVSNAREAIRIAKGGASDTRSDLAALERAVADQERSVEDARAILDRFVVTAPVAGVLADARVPQGSAVVDGQIIATVTAEETVARVAFSEADIALVEIGEAVTLSLDGAGFTISGEVLSIDSAATVENGVVAFYALIGFVDDERVRPGMTVTAHVAR